MDEENLSRAIMIGVTTLVGIMTISALILFFNSSLDVVRNVGSGNNFESVNRSDIDSTLLMSNTGNYIKGTSVINLLSYYEQDVNVIITVQNIKYIDNQGNIQYLDTVALDSEDINVRKYAYNRALRYIMDNQDFTISVQELDQDLGTMIITIRGV